MSECTPRDYSPAEELSTAVRVWYFFDEYTNNAAVHWGRLIEDILTENQRFGRFAPWRLE